MTMREFLDGLRVLWCIDQREYLECINTEDREHFGDIVLWERFRKDPHRTFAHLPSQDQQRVFAIIEKRHAAQEAKAPKNDVEDDLINAARLAFNRLADGTEVSEIIRGHLAAAITKAGGATVG